MVIALDLGTSSVRATLYDARGRAVDGRFHQVAYEPVTTGDGGVEHDPAALLEAVAAPTGWAGAVPNASGHSPDLRIIDTSARLGAPSKSARPRVGKVRSGRASDRPDAEPAGALSWMASNRIPFQKSRGARSMCARLSCWPSASCDLHHSNMHD
jgi:hypothetical protein